MMTVVAVMITVVSGSVYAPSVPIPIMVVVMMESNPVGPHHNSVGHNWRCKSTDA